MWRFALCVLLAFSAAMPAAAKSGDDDRVRFGQPIIIGQDKSVNGDVVCIACPIINHGSIRGDAVVIMGSLQNAGSVGGDSVVVMGSLQNSGTVEGDGAVVAGSLNVSSSGVFGKDVDVVMGGMNVATGATIRGKLERSLAGGPLVGVLFFVPLTIGLVVSIVLALICYQVAGHARIATIAGALEQKAALTFAAGLGVLAAFCFALWVFARMRGAPSVFVIALCVALGITMIVGYTGLSLAIGNRLRNSSPVAAVVIGAIVIAVAQAIPVLQIFFGLVLLMFALGGAALTGFGTHPEWIDQRLGGTVARPRV